MCWTSGTAPGAALCGILIRLGNTIGAETWEKGDTGCKLVFRAEPARLARGWPGLSWAGWRHLLSCSFAGGHVKTPGDTWVDPQSLQGSPVPWQSLSGAEFPLGRRNGTMHGKPSWEVADRQGETATSAEAGGTEHWIFREMKLRVRSDQLCLPPLPAPDPTRRANTLPLQNLLKLKRFLLTRRWR